MIAYLRGEIAEKTPTYIYIDVQGVAYHVNISLNTYQKLEGLEKIQLWTYMHVKEDAQQLYGFMDKAEREMFTYLISVSGIGPNTARVILSYMTAEEAAQAIKMDVPDAFNKVKGIGPKTAKRIILDLKDKVQVTEGSLVLTNAIQDNTLKQQALSALIALGFQKARVSKVLDKVLSQKDFSGPVEELIKRGLKELT
jgi:Holliday junction DNA helicase RuvA